MKRKTTQNNRKFILFTVIITLLITWLCYLPSKDNQFVNWDDHLYVYENPDIDISQSGNMEKLLTSSYASNYHPLTMLSMGINYYFAGLSPRSYHLVNVFFHLLNTLLVFFFIFMLGGKLELKQKGWLAFIAALLFGVHPLHVESVAWVSERKDVLYTFFYLFALLFYMYYLGERKKLLFFLLALLAFCLSLLSKAQAAPLAVCLLLIDYLLKRDLKSKQVIGEKIPFFMVAIAFGLLAIKTQHANYELADKYSYFERFLFASYGYVSYLLKTIVPVRLSAYYSYPKAISIFYYLSTLIVFATIAMIVIFRRNRILIFGILFFIVNILLVIQFFPVGKALMADRYFYVPSIGLFFLIAWGIVRWTEQHGSYLLPIALSVFIFFLSVLTYQRVQVWKDASSLWTSVLDFDGKCPIAWYNLGHYQHYEKGDLKSAYTAYNKTIEYGADTKLNSVYNNRGDLRTTLGDIEGGIADYNQALAIDSTYAEAYYNRGNAWFQKKEMRKALDDYNKAVLLDSLLCPAMNNRGQVYISMGEYDEALKSFNQSIARNRWTNEVKAYSFFGKASALFSQKEYADALSSLQQGLKILPGDQQALALRETLQQRLKGE